MTAREIDLDYEGWLDNLAASYEDDGWDFEQWLLENSQPRELPTPLPPTQAEVAARAAAMGIQLPF
jgi:hypothetical protein